jgi:LacI family transcriptional regulator
MNKYTVRDLAHHAAVSIGTVSRVINGAANVDPDLRERIHGSMRALRYVPRSRMRPNAGTRTWQIGILFFGPDAIDQNRHAQRAIAALERSCRAAGYTTVIEVIDRIGQLPRCIEKAQVDGVILATLETDPTTLYAVSARVPCVSINAYVPGLPMPQVCIDDAAWGRLATEEVLARGHQRIAFVNHAPGHRAFTHRRRAIEDRLAESPGGTPLIAIELPIVTTEHPFHLAPPDLGPIADRLLDANPRPTAAIVANDWGAYGLYRALRSRGVEPGRDISVVGFDNLTESALLLDPPLASVDAAATDITDTATDLVIDAIDGGPRRAHTILVPGQFHARPSLIPMTR